MHRYHLSTKKACCFNRLAPQLSSYLLHKHGMCNAYITIMLLSLISDLCHVCKQGPQNPVEMSPLQCLRSADFWMLFAINGICSGAGLTLLNNVGQQVRAACWCGDCQYFAVMFTLKCA
jgi:hypothetical protein